MKGVAIAFVVLWAFAALGEAQITNEYASLPWVDRPVKQPVILQHGWTSPDTTYLRRNIQELEKRPFTGTVTWICWPRQEKGRLWLKSLPSDTPANAVYDLTRRTITRERLPAAAMDGAIADLKATKFTRFKSNFLQCYFIAAPNLKPDFWFDDELWGVATKNFADVARAAKQGGCKGLFIDTETHEPAPWSYISLREAAPQFYRDKTWEQTRAMARRRGGEVAKALNSEFPDIVLFFMRCYSSTSAYGLYQGDDLRYHKYIGLYEAFLDGLLEGSTDQTTLVDGGENSVRFDVDRFAGCRYRALEAPLRTGLTQVPEVFKKKMRVGFGMYLSGYNDKWDPLKPAENHIPPSGVQDFVRMGLQFGDGYLWFWNEWSSWWLDGAAAAPADGVKIRDGIKWVPHEYWQAIEDGVRDARRWKSHPNMKYYQ